jgi:DNA (cytosine-5)-methyltransferase 1
MEKKMKFLDLFAGIGGFRLGLEQAGHECVGFCEIDKFARQSYKAIHNTEGEREYHDITTVSNEEWRTLRGTVELICGGFPCQAFSIAGKRKGFLDETRGTLFFEIARAAEQIKPRTLFLENVRGLLSHDKGRTFRTIISTLDELGYDAEWQILNSKNFGVPQNRERVFIIGHLRGERGREVFPIKSPNGQNDLNIIQVAQLNTPTRKNSNRFRTYSPDGIGACLSTMGGGGLEPCISVIGNVNPSRIRKLTPRECWRLQGFPDWAFDKAQEVNSNSQLYKQAGNSVTVPVIYEIARRIK